MKKLVFLFVFFCSSVSFGQTYELLPDSCTICVFTTNQGVSYNYSLHPNQDTVVMGNIYMMRETNTFIAPGQIFAFRQVGNQVKGIMHDTINEYLIMDFDAQVGDTIYNLFSDGAFYHAKVEYKDSFQLSNGVFVDYTELLTLKYSFGGNSPWVDFYRAIRWNEHGLCSEDGGLLFNIINHFVIDYFYGDAQYSTSDPQYPGNPILIYDNCVLDYNSINEIKQLSFELFPNPANDELQLRFSDMDKKEVTIINAYGQEIEQFESDEIENNLSIVHVPAGIYFVNVTTDKLKSTRMFIKN